MDYIVLDQPSGQILFNFKGISGLFLSVTD